MLIVANIFRWLAYTKWGRYAALALAVVAAGAGWRAYERHDAVQQERTRQAERDLAAIEARERASNRIGKDTDDALIDRLAGPR